MQAGGLDAKHAYIGALIVTDHVCVIRGAVFQLHRGFDIVTADHMRAGDNIGVFAGFVFPHDDACAFAGFALVLAHHIILCSF